MKLKVCLVIPTLVQGGAEKQLCLLAENLDRSRFEVDVIVLTHSGVYEDRLKSAGVSLHFIGKRAKFDPWAYRRLSRKIGELKPDIVHTWLFAANAYGRWAAYRRGVPGIIGGERSVDPWKSTWQLIVDRHLAKISSCIATNTRAVTDFYADRGIPAEKFTVIPNAVLPAERRQLEKSELFERLQIPARSKVVGAIGRLWAQKNYRELIWAAELLHAAYQDVWFVILGDGPDLKRLQHDRDLAGAKDSVRFAGHRSDAAELLSAFDVLWNGSLYEGQSNTILEAMAQGIPVVASDIPGNRDLVINDETGYLYQIGDVETLTKRTNHLLRNRELALRLGEAAQQRVQSEFSLPAMIKRHEQLYLSVAEERQQG
ncbi:MAG TPA: glycosyl transferase family 1 [Planctomycetaceae bacterium]|nr:glycosyl transferase family 1 [Planctomycetaceae bacterium]